MFNSVQKKLFLVFKLLSLIIAIPILVLLLLLIVIAIPVILKFAQHSIVNKTVQVNWQPAYNVTISRDDLSSCENSNKKTTFQWKEDLFEGTNCKLLFDEKYGGGVQYQDFKLYKNKKLALTTAYHTTFDFFDCGDKLCIFVIAPTGDSVWDYVSFGTEPPKGKLAIILWPDKKTMVFPNPCRHHNQRVINVVDSFDVKQVSTKKFFANIACTTLNMRGEVIPSYSHYRGEIKI